MAGGSVKKTTLMSQRFRGFMPVVVDVETAGFNPKRDAFLEIAAVLLKFDGDKLVVDDIISKHVQPFEGANIDEEAVAFTGIKINHPFRQQIAISEEQALQQIFQRTRKKLKEYGCTRAVLVGHNAAFDLSFLCAVAKRIGAKKNPFHKFTTFDTATLGGVVYGQTVLARAVYAAGIDWDETQAHSARYDAEVTAQLFCQIVNLWQQLNYPVSS